MKALTEKKELTMLDVIVRFAILALLFLAGFALSYLESISV